jgi:hypothetical protein
MRNNMHENRETSALSRRIGDRSGKAISRKPDMHAVEGSDRAVVPMKPPNKEVPLASAEVVEGRAWSKENVAELYEPDTERGTSVPGAACAKWHG